MNVVEGEITGTDREGNWLELPPTDTICKNAFHRHPGSLYIIHVLFIIRSVVINYTPAIALLTPTVLIFFLEISK